MPIRQHTDFKKDKVEFGHIGERDLARILLRSEKTGRVLNLCGDSRFFGLDIDLIQIRKGQEMTIGHILEDYKKPTDHRPFVMYEVKTDTCALTTRNIAYELMSNGNEGCMIRSAADWFYYIFLDGDKNIRERYLINRMKLNKWLMGHFHLINSVPWLQSKYMDREKDQTALLLINIEKLISENIARVIRPQDSGLLRSRSGDTSASGPAVAVPAEAWRPADSRPAGECPARPAPAAV